MKAKFTEGSIFRHICVMTLASTAGLFSLFLVDIVDLYWLSLLGEIALPAAIGYAGSILFFTLSLSIGLSIGCSAVVSQAIGQGDKAQTQQLVTQIAVMVALITLPISWFVVFFADTFLNRLGAEGDAAVFAQQYLTIILPSMPLLALVMAASGVLRAMGSAKAAMYLTIFGGAVNAVLDPVFIFVMDWGIQGAAVATVISRMAMLMLAIYLMKHRYQLLVTFTFKHFKTHLLHYAHTAVPAVFTNLATPIGVAYVTAVMAQFGDEAVAGNAIISKLQPLAFAGIFALSGAVGPIAGQNLGAGKMARIQAVLQRGLQFILIYCLMACGVLMILKDHIIVWFSAKGDAIIMIQWFCYGLSSIFIFQGATFLTNALFNNLKVAYWATAINFARATLFTMPFVSFGASQAGPMGALWGLYGGSVLISIVGIVLARWKISRLAFMPRQNQLS